ncbi:hypothetical protein H1R20_g14153, partial [Candolleomyces eurysporus]
MEEEEGDDDEEDDATTKNPRGLNSKRNQSGRGRVRAPRYREQDTAEEEDEDEEGADPSYRQGPSTTRKPRTNGHSRTIASASEDDATSDEDVEEQGTKAPVKSSKQRPSDTNEPSDNNKSVPADGPTTSSVNETEEDDYEEEDDEPSGAAQTKPVSSIASPVRSTLLPKPLSPRTRVPADKDASSKGPPDSAADNRADGASSAASSREGTPAPSEDEEVEQRTSLADVSRQRRASLLESAGIVVSNADSSAKRSTSPAKGGLKDQDGDVEMAPDAEGEGELPEDNDNDGDRSVGDIDQDGDVDVEGEENDNDNENRDGENDDDLEQDNEMDSDLQPAHRAEALDALAVIEFKWAQLREQIYIQKMDALAWEEDLIKQGNHPEMIHLLGELTSRRDKRVELASRKRMHEMASVGKRQRAEESAIWSWWAVTRDELQTEMTSETNRKRRRLERERRAVERPPPNRRVPPPPTSIPPAPSLRKIVKSLPFSNSSKHGVDFAHQTPDFIYPELQTLSSADVAQDLEFLLQNRRHSNYDSRDHRGPVNPNPTTVPSGLSGPPQGQVSTYDPGHHGDAYSRPPPPQPMHHPSNGPHPGNYPYIAGPQGVGRIHHHQAGPGGPPNTGPGPNHPSHPSQAPHSHVERERIEHDLGGPIGHGPGHQIHPNHPFFGPGRNGAMYPPTSSHVQDQPPKGVRRSPSPGVLMNGDGPVNKHGRDGPPNPPPGTWLGQGMGMATYMPPNWKNDVDRPERRMPGRHTEADEEWLKRDLDRKAERAHREEIEKREYEKSKERERQQRMEIDHEHERQQQHMMMHKQPRQLSHSHIHASRETTRATILQM